MKQSASVGVVRALEGRNSKLRVETTVQRKDIKIDEVLVADSDILSSLCNRHYKGLRNTNPPSTLMLVLLQCNRPL